MKEISVIKSHGEEDILVYRLVDIFIMLVSFLVISYLYLGSWPKNYILAAAVTVVVFVINSELVGLYNSKNYQYLKQIFTKIIISWLCTIGLLLAIAFGIKVTALYSRFVIVIWLFSVPCMLFLYRFIYSRKCSRSVDQCYTQKCIIIGATHAGLALANEIESTPSLGLKLFGLFDDRTPERLFENNTHRTISGNIDEAVALAKDRSFKHVYVALPMNAANRIKTIIDAFSDSTANVYIVPDFFTFDLIQSRWRNVGNVPTLSIHDTPFNGMSKVVKRIEDIVLSTIILILISPVLLFVALGVRMSSPGPIIFKQNRYGIDGQQIKVWKFRSMKTLENGNVVKQATRSDPRITKFGAFIRRTSLDELPQFINVLQGRMSIVGPRPHAVAHNEQYRQIVDKYMLRHKVKPGITGWAQVNGYRGETDTIDKMEKRIEFDLIYIRNWSLGLDIKIVFMTLTKGIFSDTAY